MITGLSIPNAPMKIGDIVTLTITVEDDGGDIYPTSGGYGPITRINSTTYTLQFEITEGNADIAAGDDFPFELEIIDSAGNASNFFEGVISQDNDPIDANRPTISSVSIPDVAMSVGDAVTVSITAGEAGLTLTSGTINGVAVTGFTDNGAGNYSATYTVLEGHTDRAAGDAIPVSFVLADPAGNESETFTTAISQASDLIDANSPTITAVEGPTSIFFGELGGVDMYKVGEEITLSITASESGLTLSTGIVNGVAVTDFTDLGDGNYQATYTVTKGDADRAQGEDIPVTFVLEDPAGNISNTFVAPFDMGNALIDANSPTISSIVIPDTAMKVGDVVTVSITASEAGLSLTSGTINGVAVTGFSDIGVGNYEAIYTVLEGHTNRASKATIPVSFVLSDTAGNASDTFTTAISQSSDSIDANSPVITAASIPDSAINVGDVVTVTLTVAEGANDIYTNLVGTVGGYELGNLSRISDTSYAATFTVTPGGADVSAGVDIPVSVTLDDTAGNTSAVFITIINTDSPTITTVSIPDSALKVGDVVTVSITASEAGLSLNTGTVNGVAVTGFTDNGAGNYSATYTVLEGHTDRGAGDSIPVSFVLEDTDGHISQTYATAISQSSDSIDANTPTITSVSIPDVPVKVGDQATITITASEAGLNLNAGTVNGVDVTGFTDNSDGTYSAIYTVAEGDTDIAAADDIPVSFILADPAGNDSVEFTTAISQTSDSIDANSPVITGVSLPNIPYKIGDTFTFTYTVEDDGGDVYSDPDGTGVVTRINSTTYEVSYVLSERSDDLLNYAAEDSMFVQHSIFDSAGNEGTYFHSINQDNDPIDRQRPTLNDVSISDSAMKVGDAVSVTITANEVGLTLTSGTVNGVAVTDFTDNSDGTYSAIYTVTEGDTDIAAGDDIPVSFILADPAGNASNEFTTAISQSSDAIDANSPVITGVSLPNIPYKIGDIVLFTVSVEDDGGDTYTALHMNSTTRINSTTYLVQGQVQAGFPDIAAEDDVTASFVFIDSAGNESVQFDASFSQDNDPVDSNRPTISAVSILNAAMNVGDAVTVSITAGEAGLALTSGSINGVAVTGFTDNGGGNYTAIYTVLEGHTDRAAGDAIPVSFVLADPAGNVSDTFTTEISQASDSIDANSPTISSVSIADTAMNVGDVVTVSITANEAGLTLNTGTVNGVAVTGFTDNSDGTYGAIYTVTEGDTDIAAGDDIPLSFILVDPAGNASNEFTTAISQSSDAIDANTPTISDVSITASEANVGDQVTVTITASETGLSLANGTVNGVAVTDFIDNNDGTYSAIYTVEEGDTDRVAGEAIPVAFVLEDSVGNLSDEYIEPITQSTTKVVFDLINGTSTEVGDRGFLSDETYDIYIQVPSDSGTLAGPDVWSGADNLGIDDTIHLVGSGSPVINDSGKAITAGTFSGATIFWATMAASSPTSSFTPGAVLNSNGSFIRGYNGLTSSQVPLFTGALQFNAVEIGDVYNNLPNVIDANSPVITEVSLPNVVIKVGETATVTLTVEDDNGDIYTNLVGTVGGFELSNLIRVDNTTYTADFTVQEGGTDVSINEDIPVSLTLEDAAGNTSNEFAGPVSQSNTRVILDLINGTSTDIDGRAFSSDKAYDIYILVDSESETLVGPSQLWSDKTNLDADDTIYLVGNGAPILNGAGNAVVSGRFDSTAVYWSSIASTYNPGAILNSSGKFIRDYSSNTNFVGLFTSDTLWASFKVGDIYSTPPNIIDANTPTIASVSIPDKAMAIDDIVSVTISASESGLSLVSGSVNGIAVTDFTDNGGGSYSAIYTVAEEHTEIAAGDDIPVSFVLADSAGNDSAAFTTAIIQTSDPIDVRAPEVLDVSISQDVMKVGDVVTVTLTLWDDLSDDIYTNLSGTVGGFALSNLSRIDSTTYTAEFTVTEDGSEYAAGEDIPVSLTLDDPAGNTSAVFTAPATQSSTKVVFDLINGTSSDIDSRVFSADETYDIYILVDSDSAALSQPDLWSDAANLGSDDTLHLVGDGSPIINVSGNAINQVMTTTSGAIVWYSLSSSEIAGSTAAFTPGATLASGVFVRAYGSNSTSSSVQLFTITNSGDGFSLGNIYNRIPNVLDANSPTILDVSTTGSGLGVIDLSGDLISGDLTGITLGSEITSIPSSTGVTLDPVNVVTVGQSLMISIVASESGLSLTSGTVNGIAVTDFYDLGYGFYTAVYTVAEGHTDRAADEVIPVAFVLQDLAGNTSDEYTSTITLAGDAIDANGPTISEVSIPNVPMKVGDEVLVTINANEAGLSPTYLNVNGALLTDFTDLGDGTYTAIYTVLQGYTDIAADVDIPVWITLEDSAGNRSEEFTAISQNNDPIDSNAPEVLDVSISQDVMKVGDVVTVTLTLWDDLSDDIYTNLSGTVGGFALSNLSRIDSTTYTAEFTVTEDGADVAAGEDIPVSLTLDDPAGNTSAVFTAPATQSSTKVVFDLINGTSSDIDSRVFSADETYDIYILVDSDSAALSQPDLWSDAANLGSDDTLHLVGDGSPIINAAGNAIKDVTSSGTQVFWFSLGSSETIGTALFTPGASALSGVFVRAYGSNFTSSSVQLFTSNNLGYGFSLGDIYSTVPNVIDANTPVITEVAMNPRFAGYRWKVGDEVTVTLTVDDDGGDIFTNLSGTVGGFDLSNLSRIDSTTYTAEFTVIEGGADVAVGDDIPVSLTLDDSAGNTSTAFTTPATQSITRVVFDLINGTSTDIDGRAFSSDELYDIYIVVDSMSTTLKQPELWTDAENLADNAIIYLVGNGFPVETSRPFISDGVGHVLDQVNFYTNAISWNHDLDGPSTGTYLTGAKLSMGNFSRGPFTSLSVMPNAVGLFTHQELNYGDLAMSNIPSLFNLIDANSPVITEVSLSQDVMKVDDVVIVTLTVEDDGGNAFRNISGTVGGFDLSNLSRINSTTYTAEFTVIESGADVAAGDEISVAVRLSDYGGNTSALFTAPATQSSTKVVFDLINGTSSDIDSRVFSADETYDIYILVDSDSAALSQPDLWSDAANLGSDDTLHLVGDGSPIINVSGNAINQVMTTASGAIVWYSLSSSEIAGSTAAFTPGATLASGVFVRAYGSNSTSSSVQLFTNTNSGDGFSLGNIYSAVPNVIDANAPVITYVSIPNAEMTTGDQVTVTIIASEADLNLVSGSINGVAVTDFEDDKSVPGAYTAVYTVGADDPVLEAGDEIPVSFVMSDDAGNQSAEFTFAISQTNDSINGPTITAPVITGLSIPNAPIKIGDVVTLTITVEDDGGDIYPTDGVGPITRINSTTYTSEFTIPDGSVDFAAGEDIPFETQIFDSAGNASNVFKVSISQDNDPIDANAPVITNASMSGNATKVGDTVTVTITVEDDGGDIYTGLVGNVGGFALGAASRIDNTTYTADFTVQEGGADVALNSDILISLTLEDTAGNTSNEFAGPVIQKNTNTRVIFDLINGTSTDIDGRVITANKTYDIYILVDSNSKSVTLDSSETWSGKANLGADDTIYLVGNGSPILNRADDFIITTTGTSHFINWYSTPNNLNPGAHLSSAGLFQRSYNSFNSNVDLFSTTNSWDGLQFGDIYSTLPNIIDANTPTITSVSIPDTAMTVDDVVTVTISASESGLRLVSGEVNGVLVTGFTDNGDGSYSAIYTVAEGHTEIAAGDDIPVSFVLEDSAGNSSTAFTAAISQGSDAIDINPDASNVRVVFDLIAGTSTDIDGRTFASDKTYDIYIQVDSDSPALSQPTTWSSASNLGSDDTIYLVGNGSNILDGSGQTITQGIWNASIINWSDGAYLWSSSFSRYDGASLAVMLFPTSILSTLINIGPVLTTLPEIDLTSPVIEGVSIPDAPMTVGDTVTVTLTVEDDNGDIYTNLVGTVGGFELSNLMRVDNTTYTADFTVQEGGADVSVSEDIPVSLTLQDAAGNTSNEFAGPVTQTNTRVVFDLVSGTSTDIDGRSFSADETYDIYILVDSDSAALSQPDLWSNKANLGSDDTIYLVGNGSQILDSNSGPITNALINSFSHTILWYSAAGTLAGAALDQNGIFERLLGLSNVTVQLFTYQV